MSIFGPAERDLPPMNKLNFSNRQTKGKSCDCKQGVSDSRGSWPLRPVGSRREGGRGCPIA